MPETPALSKLTRRAFCVGMALALSACTDDTVAPSDTNGGSGGAMQPVAGGSGAGATAAGNGGSSASGSGGSSPLGGAGSGSGGSAGAGLSAGAGSGGVGLGGGSGGAGGTGTGGMGAAGAAGSLAGAGSGGSGGSGGAAGASGQGGASGGKGGMAGGGAGGSTYQPCPATGACTIMPFGDSITEGFPVNGGYRSELFRIARNGGHEITFVGSANNNSPSMVDGVTFPRNHEGHGGYTIEGTNGIAQFVNTSIPNYRPDIITLMIGTNDINGNINVSDAPNRLGRLLDSIFAADADVLVVLAQIVPTRTDGTNNTVRTYNAAMPGLVSARTAMGRHIVLIDMYGAFTRTADYKTSLLGDNLHPNQAGYTRMAETWYPVLEPYLR